MSEPATIPPKRRRRFRRRRTALRGLLSALALGAVGSAAVFTTQATFTDQVTMAQVTVQGGTLDLKANGGDGPNQAWNVSANTTNMAPGQTATGQVVVRNNGTLPFSITVSKTGTDDGAPACFSYWFREAAVVTGSGASTFPVNLTGMGTGTTDALTAPMAATSTNVVMQDNGAGDTVWESGDSKRYDLTVRMNTACATNGANGTMNFTFNATQ